MKNFVWIATIVALNGPIAWSYPTCKSYCSGSTLVYQAEDSATRECKVFKRTPNHPSCMGGSSAGTHDWHSSGLECSDGEAHFSVSYDSRWNSEWNDEFRLSQFFGVKLEEFNGPGIIKICTGHLGGPIWLKALRCESDSSTPKVGFSIQVQANGSVQYQEWHSAVPGDWRFGQEWSFTRLFDASKCRE